MMKKKPQPKQHPEYGRGYRAGLKRWQRSTDRVVLALHEQAEYWRQNYLDIRDGKDPVKARAARRGR